MAANSSANLGIKDLVTRIELASENVSQAKQELLDVSKKLTEKLESPDTTIWKVVFGVRSSHKTHPCRHRGASIINFQ